MLVAAVEEDLDTFTSRATRAGSALWSGDEVALEEILAELPSAEENAATRTLAESDALRTRLGHYSGAMFYYAGEWYWGIDRLYHLEQRLTEIGARRSPSDLRYPRPPISMDRAPRASEMKLEVLPSLRSPYTAISFERTLELAERTGIDLVVRPVLPMVMRGVPVTFTKGRYIMRDTLRESEMMKIPFGRMLDPIGEPVRRAYSLWPWAQAEGKGSALLASFLRAAFCEGIDTSREAGMRVVVERAGLDWEAARERLGDPAWEKELESNRLAMIHEMGQWGVPSFRLTGPEGEPELCCWGQDRLWLISREIQRRGRL